METLPLICLITAMFFDCDPNMKPTPEQQKLMVRYEAADKKIGDYFDVIESSKTTDDERKKIVCESFPSFYNKEYKPLLLQVNKHYTGAELDLNLKQAVDSFQKQYNIKC